MIIAPAKQFLIDYKINNPSDTATHYVRAVIKNSISGATITTLNLTDNGSGYFSKEWMTPNDPTGNGFQVSVLITVYDDAGYTQESLVYGTTLETYIIRDLASPRLGIGGAGAGMRDGLDEKKVEKIIRRIFAELFKFPEFPEVKFPEFPAPYNDSHIQKKLEEIHGKIPLPAKDRADEIVGRILESQEINAIKELPSKFEQAEIEDEKLHERLNKFLDDQEETKKQFFKDLRDILEKMAISIEEGNDKIEEIIKRPVNVVFNSRPEPDERTRLKKADIDEKRQKSIEALLG